VIIETGIGVKIVSSSNHPNRKTVLSPSTDEAENSNSNLLIVSRLRKKGGEDQLALIGLADD
jgi:hypothetical protein